MQQLQTISAKDYLSRKQISYRESGKELITKCLFNRCDEDSVGNEAHLYFETETGKYDCKKCGQQGNLVTLAKHLGDRIQDVITYSPAFGKSKKSTEFNQELVETCHQALPLIIRQYLNARGIVDSIVDAYKLGWGKFYGKWWITIPIQNEYGSFCFFKLRQDPNVGDKKITYPKGIEAQIYGWDTLQSEKEKIIFCEGELDRLALLSKDISAITSTHGAGTFKQEWVEKIGTCRKIFICFDNDDAGKNGMTKVSKMLEKTENELFIITLPQELGVGGDITDYLSKSNGNLEDLFSKFTKAYPEKIDTSKFEPLSPQDLVEILGLTIKHDEENKIVTFLCELSAFTENAQFNISYNAPSSTGKSYIPLEISSLFPDEDVMKLGNCSPTAFFHEQGEYDKDKNTITVDLSRKIIIFLDQPHSQLLERLRSLLSHDEKEMRSKITDKNQKGGNRTKTVIIKGFPSVIFCTAKVLLDEQETTRFLLLSPEISQEKIREGVLESIKKETNSKNYKEWINENPERRLLKERILAIKQESVGDVIIGGEEKIKARFLTKSKMLKPRHQRDIKRIVSIIKSLAIVNLWWRERDSNMIVANDDDIEQAFKIWDSISESQEHNLPPFIYNLYKDVIRAIYIEKNGNRSDEFVETTGLQGISRQEILKKHYGVYGRMLGTNQLRQEILPMLETAGLIVQEADQSDKRKILVYPTELFNKSEE